MKIADAHAIANSVGKTELSEEYISPSVFSRDVFGKVAVATSEAAYESGAAERHRKVHPVFI